MTTTPLLAVAKSAMVFVALEYSNLFTVVVAGYVAVEYTGSADAPPLWTICPADPVAMAAMDDVPSPTRMPWAVYVDGVYGPTNDITGVVVPLATATWFVVPDTDVTDPALGTAHDGIPDANVNTLPSAAAANLDNVFVADAYRMSPVAYVVMPVPPNVGPIAVAFQTPVVTVPNVVNDVWPT